LPSEILYTTGFEKVAGGKDVSDGFPRTESMGRVYQQEDDSSGWEIAGRGDYDGNEISDILFTDGTSLGCYMDGWRPNEQCWGVTPPAG